MPAPDLNPPSDPRPFADRFRRRLSFCLAVFFLSAAIGAAAAGMISPWLSQAYLAMSLATMVAYGLDKEKAGNGEWRMKESLLHLSELVGGWPGALLAQQLFRHKTRKTSYQVVFWLIVGLHLGLWTWAVLERKLPVRGGMQGR